MGIRVKQYAYSKGTDEMLDADFAAAEAFGKVRIGQKAIFWRSGLRWGAVPAAYIQRVFRRREAVIRKGCCGGKSFFIERLVMILLNGEELEVHIGDDIPKDAEALLAQLQRRHPGFQFGKV